MALLDTLVLAKQLCGYVDGIAPTNARTDSINGIDITDHPEHLWQHVAYLPQEIFMIDGSVKQNIALGVPNSAIDEAQLSYAINQAQMHEVVANLPCGIDTNLGENGVNLSGGQRQRIALARAFYFDRKILVLDEATSSLDNDTEDQIIDYLKSIKNKVTVISITHRVNSIEHCGRVFQLSNGMLKDLNKQKFRKVVTKGEYTMQKLLSFCYWRRWVHRFSLDGSVGQRWMQSKSTSAIQFIQ